MGKKTVLYDEHVEAGARLVDFAGWDMPLHYGSQIEEHRAVRADAGMFDVSHMCTVDIAGGQARSFLRYLFANDVDRLKGLGRALYTCMLNESGGVLDDMIVYYLHDAWFRVVVNAATREKDVDWMRRQAGDFDVEITPLDTHAIIAAQGPQGREKTLPVLEQGVRGQVMDLKPFQALSLDDLFISRTGYTGEDGFEIILPGEHAPFLWRQLRDMEVTPCGLGARDTLRLEAGLHLYGQDMDEDTDPISAGLGWTVALEPGDREFVGRRALEALPTREELAHQVGLVFTGRGVLRAHQAVYAGGSDTPAGETTSGGYSPTLNCSIALARVHGELGADCEVAMRGRRTPVQVVKPLFVRHGEVQIPLDQ
jgi:aminomethyltransferase